MRKPMLASVRKQGQQKQLDNAEQRYQQFLDFIASDAAEAMPVKQIAHCLNAGYSTTNKYLARMRREMGEP